MSLGLAVAVGALKSKEERWCTRLSSESLTLLTASSIADSDQELEEAELSDLGSTMPSRMTGRRLDKLKLLVLLSILSSSEEDGGLESGSDWDAWRSMVSPSPPLLGGSGCGGWWWGFIGLLLGRHWQSGRKVVGILHVPGMNRRHRRRIV